MNATIEQGATPVNAATNIFEMASRMKLRFASPKGELNVEDLWRLPLTSENPAKANLDAIGRAYRRQMKQDDADESLVNPNSTSKSPEIYLAFEIVKHIIGVRMAENATKLDSEKKAALKEKLIELRDKKKDEALGQKSAEELDDMIASL